MAFKTTFFLAKCDHLGVDTSEAFAKTRFNLLEPNKAHPVATPHLHVLLINDFAGVECSDCVDVQDILVGIEGETGDGTQEVTGSSCGVYSEASIKWPLNWVAFQDRWSFMTGRINMILGRPWWLNDEIDVFSKTFQVPLYITWKEDLLTLFIKYNDQNAKIKSSYHWPKYQFFQTAAEFDQQLGSHPGARSEKTP